MLALAHTPLLAALLAPGDPLVTLIAPLAGVLVLLLLAALLGELQRTTTAASATTNGEPSASSSWVVALTFGGVLFARGVATWGPDEAGTDSFEAARAGGVAAIGLGALLLGYHWPRLVGVLAVRAGIALALLGGLVLCWQGLAGQLGPGAGLLGNTGYDAQLLLPGAAAGLFVLALARDPRSAPALLGSIAFALAALYAGLAPAIGAALVLAVFGLGALALSSQRLLVGGLLVVGLTLGLFGNRVAAFHGQAPAPQAAASTTAAPDAALGGVGVRLAIWRTLLSGDLPRPVETGQFQATYPPHRDPAELAATTGSQTLEEITEVEHPHNDLLLSWVEGRFTPVFLVGGLLLVYLALGNLLLRRWASRNQLPLAAGALALVLAGSFHSPLLVNPAAALLGWLLVGAWLGRLACWRSDLALDHDGAPAEEVPSHGPGLGAALAADLDHRGGRWSLATRLITLGLALLLVGKASTWAPLEAEDLLGERPPELASTESARLAIADGRLPFGVVALHARSLQADDPIAAAAFWDLALELRPHSVEALIQRGLLAAIAGDLSQAHWRWARAAELYPGYPPLVANLHLLGADLVLGGELQAGLAELDDVLGELNDLPEQHREPVVLLRAASLSTEPKLRAAFALAAHWLQARRQAEAGDIAACQVSLERAALAARTAPGDQPPALHFGASEPGDPSQAGGPLEVPAELVDASPAALQVELAACEAAAGDLGGARERLGRLLEDPRNTRESLLSGAPTWAQRTAGILLP
ncbi:MAG: hypothetical protein P1V81_08270 [Planctomycetota bacterium]|nr:hypothetical protein [Planctomycetota bacterium]